MHRFPSLLLLLTLLTLLPRSIARAQTQAEPINPPAAAPASPKEDSLQTRVEAFLRHYYAWGLEYEVKAGPETQSPIPDMIEMPVTVSMDGASDTAAVFVTKDGKYLFRGDLSNMTVDPFAETRAKLHPDGWPSKGPADAKVLLVEYADFECPSCKGLDSILRDILPKYPNVRLVYKYFPLTSIHPWAMTAAIAAQCVYKQNPDAFWKVHDEIYDQQDSITMDDVQEKLAAFAEQTGINMDSYRSCISDAETTRQINQSVAEGHALDVDSTPTIFVNGRRIVGASDMLLQQLIHYELSN